MSNNNYVLFYLKIKIKLIFDFINYNYEMISQVIIDTIREFDCYCSIYDRIMLDNSIDKNEMINIAKDVNNTYRVIEIMDKSFIVIYKCEKYVVIFDKQMSNGEPYVEVSKYN